MIEVETEIGSIRECALWADVAFRNCFMGGCGIQAGVERRVRFLRLDVEAEAFLTEEHRREVAMGLWARAGLACCSHGQWVPAVVWNSASEEFGETG